MLVHPDLIKAYGHYCTDSAYIAHFLAVLLVTRVVRAEALGDLVHIVADLVVGHAWLLAAIMASAALYERATIQSKSLS